MKEYERMRDIRASQNKPRGKSGRTSPEIEELVIRIYQESFEPERPKGRRYSAAKVARLLAKRHQVPVGVKNSHPFDNSCQHRDFVVQSGLQTPSRKVGHEPPTLFPCSTLYGCSLSDCLTLSPPLDKTR